MEIKNEEYGVAGIHRLKLELDAGDLWVVESEVEDKIFIAVEKDEKDHYESQILGDTLQIEYDWKKRLISNRNCKVRMTVKIPKGKWFDEVSLELGAGNADLRSLSISCGSLKLETGAGNVSLGRVETEHGMDIEIGAGSVEVTEAKVTDLRVKCGVGDCSIGMQGKESDYNYHISCGVGQIRINDNYMKQIGGSENRKNPDAKGTIKLSCGVGNIEIRTQNN